MFDPDVLALAAAVLSACCRRGWHLATAESCTGGLVVGALTAIGGSSDVVERGFVTYSNGAKSELLGVPPEIIAEHGAVSAETAAAMAQGAPARAPVDLAPLVGASLEIMDRDAKRMRGDRPFVFTNLKTGEGVDRIRDFVVIQGGLSSPARLRIE